MDRVSTAARVANWRLRRVSTLAMVGRVALRVFFPMAARKSATSFCASWGVRVGELY